MAKFPSQAWADLYREALAGNDEYREAARAWEGDILLKLDPDAEAPGGAGIHLDLAHGACRSARFLPDATGAASEFVFSASRAQWTRLLRREVDPVRAILDGTVRVQGNLAKLMRFTRAAKALVETAGQVPTEL